MNTLKDYKDTNDYIFDIAEKKDLKPSEIALLFAINSLSDNDKKLCFASNKVLSKKINLSVDRTSRLINGLKKKNIIKVQTFKVAKSITINETPYAIYRLITIVIDNDTPNQDNSSVCADNNTPSYVQRKGVGSDNVTLSLQTTNKSTNKESTNYNSTNNLSKTESGTRNTEKQNNQVENKGSEREGKHNSETQALFDYALDKIKANSKIGDKVSYAKVMVKNWQKQGIKSVSQLESSMTKTNSKPKFVENMPSWYSSKVNDSQPNNENSVDIKADIERLKVKIG